MPQLDDYNSQLPLMQALPADEVKKPTIPIEKMIQESEDLHPLATKYIEQFKAVGLVPEILDLLQVRTGTLRHAESQWKMNYNAQQESIKQWDEKSPQAFELKRKLNQIFRYAYRNEKRILGRVREISKGYGNEDMIQDLNDYAALGKEYPEQLNKINVDITMLDKATEYATTLGDILALANGNRNEQHQLRDLRDRAYTLLKETVVEIRDCGKYVFADNPETQKLFTSNYLRNRRRKSEEHEEQNTNN